MVSQPGGRLLLRVCLILCFALLVVSFLATCGWLLLASFDLGWPIPRIILYMACLFLAQIASLIFYFKRPWVAALTGWVDVLVILIGVVPRNSASLNSFFHQFMFDLVFWVAANGGMASYFALNRGKNSGQVMHTTRSTHL